MAHKLKTVFEAETAALTLFSKYTKYAHSLKKITFFKQTIQGENNASVFIRTNDGLMWVVRLIGYGSLCLGGDDPSIEHLREARFLQMYEKGKILYIDETGNFIKLYFPGRTFSIDDPSDKKVLMTEEYFRLVGKEMSKINRIDHKRLGIEFDIYHGFPDDYREYLDKEFAKFGSLCVKYIQSHATTLSHNDIHPNNVVYDVLTHRAKIIDYEFLCYSHVYSDICYFLDSVDSLFKNSKLRHVFFDAYKIAEPSPLIKNIMCMAHNSLGLYFMNRYNVLHLDYIKQRMTKQAKDALKYLKKHEFTFNRLLTGGY
ncbi:MAG: hypothetical protein Ta2E_02740 [Mycoplasmoidaceae bacterium]|nr:MAG: hypothetical protein Ta2E_02740 [Mycoplasmoidaceae bacterium]